MPTISTLTVDFTANTTKLDTSLATSVKQIKGHASAIQESVDDIKRAFEALGVGLGVSELISWGEELIKSTADLKSMAAQVGLTTDQFQVMRFEATELGVAQGEMDTAVAHLTRTIGDAAEGSKTAIEAFNKLGVGVLDSQGKVRSTADVMRDVAARLADIPDPAIRATTEVALFGRAGQQLDPLLRQGASGMDTATASMNQFVGSISGDTIEKFDEMNRNIDEMKLHLHNLAVEALGATSAIINFFATGGGHLAPGTQRPVPGETPEQRARRQNGGFPETGHELGGGDLNLPGIGSTTNPIASAGVGAAANAQADAAERTIKSLQEQAEQLQRTGEALDLYNALTKAGVDLDSEAGQQIAELVHQIDQEKAAHEAAAKAAQEHDAELREAAQIHEQVLTPQQRYEEELAKINKLLKDGVLSQADYNAKLKLMQADLNDASKSADGMSSQTDHLSRGFDNLSSSVAGAAVGTQSWADVATSAIREVINGLDDLLRSWLNLSSSGGGSGGLFNGLFSGGFLNSINAFFGLDGLGGSSLIGGGAGGFAEGGRPPVGEASIVGESGPELFVPDMAGTVLPHDALNSLGSGSRGGMSVTINAQGADPAGLARVTRALEQLNATFENRAIAAVGNARARGGAFARTFGG